MTKINTTGQKALFFVALIGVLLVPSGAFACGYSTYSSLTKEVKASELSQALIIWREGVEHLVIDPGLTGDAPDFGLAFAFPSRPEVTEAPRAMFDELEDATFDQPLFSGFAEQTGSAGTARESAVKVIETKKVGDFQATILTAENSGALIDWLKKHKYRFTSEDQENFEYYVSKGGYYFVALKIQLADRQAKKLDGEYELRPIQFTFHTSQPIFPLRLARDNDPQSKFRIYAIAKNPLIVPGAGVAFSSPYQGEEWIPSLAKYLQDAWLTKLDMWIDPSKIEHDLTLVEWQYPQEFRRDYEELIDDPEKEGFLIPNPYFQPYPLLVAPEGRDAGAGIVAVADPSDLDFPANKISVIWVLVPWYENPKYYPMIGIALGMILVYSYVAVALHSLAKKLGTSHRWRAWVPFANLHLIVQLAGLQRRWFFVIIAVLFAPLIIRIILSVTVFFMLPWYSNLGVSLNFISLVGLIFSFLFLLIIFSRVFASLARRCGRPSWWGPLMIFLPPIGLVLLGVLAWSKQKPPTVRR